MSCARRNDRILPSTRVVIVARVKELMQWITKEKMYDGGWRWVEVDGGGRRWMEVDGGGAEISESAFGLFVGLFRFVFPCYGLFTWL